MSQKICNSKSAPYWHDKNWLPKRLTVQDLMSMVEPRQWTYSYVPSKKNRAPRKRTQSNRNRALFYQRPLAKAIHVGKQRLARIEKKKGRREENN